MAGVLTFCFVLVLVMLAVLLVVLKKAYSRNDD
jgi:hypothetical protein